MEETRAYDEAIELLTSIMTGYQLLIVANKMAKIQARGWGEVSVAWRNGKVDMVRVEVTDKLTLNSTRPLA